MVILFAVILSTGAFAKDITDRGWVLVAMDNQAIDGTVSLRIDSDGRFHGRAPCNQYFGNHETNMRRIKFGVIAATRMACSQLGLEKMYFDRLATVRRAEIEDGFLVLNAKDGAVLRFMSRD